MPKFGRIYQALIREGIASIDQFYVPEPADSSLLELVHNSDYVQSFLAGSIEARAMRRIGLPWSASLVTRTCTAVGGTMLTAHLATRFGLACSTAGGTHHAHSDFGSGFCIFNDLAISARWAMRQGLARSVLIVDLDVHQGDGTAAIFSHDPSVHTVSVHCGANFPYRKHPSDFDVSLPIGASDSEYLEALRTLVPDLLADVAPDLVLYDAGVDPHIEDRLGKMSLSSAGLYARDRLVIDSCVSSRIPIGCVVGGGYDRDIDRLARRHCILHQAADDAYRDFRL